MPDLAQKVKEFMGLTKEEGEYQYKCRRIDKKSLLGDFHFEQNENVFM